MYELTTSDIDADVVDNVWASCPEENQVSSLQIAFAYIVAGILLILCTPLQRDALLSKDVLCKRRAIKD